MEKLGKVVLSLVMSLLVTLLGAYVIMILLNGYLPTLGYGDFFVFVIAGMTVVNLSIVTMKVKVDSLW